MLHVFISAIYAAIVIKRRVKSVGRLRVKWVDAISGSKALIHWEVGAIVYRIFFVRNILRLYRSVHVVIAAVSRVVDTGLVSVLKV